MTNEQFNNITKAECLEAARQCHKSAEGHFKVAESAAAMQHLGIATSLMILAVEECVKGILFSAKFISGQVPMDVAPYFKNHGTKHAQAAEVQSFLNMIWHAKDLFTSILANRKSDYETHSRVTINGALLIILTKALEALTGPGEDFSQWWTDANKQKNDGFYVGYFNNKWNFPSECNEATFLLAQQMAKPFVESLGIVQTLQESDYLLFSADKQFTKEEIESSRYKIFSSE